MVNSSGQLEASLKATTKTTLSKATVKWSGQTDLSIRVRGMVESRTDSVLWFLQMVSRRQVRSKTMC